MKLTWLPILIPVAVGATAAQLTDVMDWSGWQGGLLPALSVIAAAVLVRLARGLPFSNPDQFDPVEVVKVTDAIKQLARALRGLIYVILITMLALVLAPAAVNEAGRHFNDASNALIGKAVCATLGLLVSYAFVRILQVVQSDVSLIDRQSKMLTDAVRNKHAKAFETAIAKDLAPFKNPKGYAEPLH